MDQRKIVHVDMDAFYASVEQLDNPELRGKPIAVGGSAERGVVTAASYESRKFGVRSAMSSVQAKKNCPNLIFVKPRFDRYREISKKIRAVFLEYTDLVEPLSLDEAYLDVTDNKMGNPSASLIAREIRKQIKEKTGLNASAGISINKFIAKVASDVNKPNGQKAVPPEEVEGFLEALEISKFHGVGKVTTQKMYKLGIFTGSDLKQKSSDFLTDNFGKAGSHYFNVVRGIHNSAVKPERKRKSVGAERTFTENLASEIFMLEKLERIAGEMEKRLLKNNLAGKTVTLKIKYSDFNIQTRSKTLSYFIAAKELILENAKQLLYQDKMQNSVRLLGISLSNLNNETHTKEEENEPIVVQLKFDF
jgi:DNA polymerase-4